MALATEYRTYIGAALAGDPEELIRIIGYDAFGDDIAVADDLHDIALVEPALDPLYAHRKQGPVSEDGFAGALVYDQLPYGVRGLYPTPLLRYA